MSAPLIVSRDPAVIEAIMAAAAAVQVEPDVARDTDTLRRGWLSASVVLIGADQAPTVAGLGLPPRRKVHLCGPDAKVLMSWSVPLEAPVMVLPEQTGFVSSLLAGIDELPDEPPVVLRVIGGSGGVGATTVAAGLAQRAAKQDLRVAAAELDATGGGLDLVFGAERAPGWRWPDLRSAAGHIGDLRGRLPNVSGVDLVSTGRPRVSDSRRTDSGLPSFDAINAVVASLLRSHDLVILDAGSHPDVTVTSRAESLLVVAAEVKAVMTARSKVATWGLSDAQVIVRKGPGRRLAPEMIEDTLGLPVVGSVPHDARLPGSLEAGIPPGLRRGRFARACDALLNGVLRDE